MRVLCIYTASAQLMVVQPRKAFGGLELKWEDGRRQRWFFFSCSYLGECSFQNNRLSQSLMSTLLLLLLLTFQVLALPPVWCGLIPYLLPIYSSGSSYSLCLLSQSLMSCLNVYFTHVLVVFTFLVHTTISRRAEVLSHIRPGTYYQDIFNPLGWMVE